MHNQTQEQEIRCVLATFIQWNRSSPLLVFLVKCVLKIYSKFTGEHPYQSEISKNFLCNFAEITLRHGCFPVNLLYILRPPFPKNTYGGVFLEELFSKKKKKKWDKFILRNFWNSQILMEYFTVAWPGSGTKNNIFLVHIIHKKKKNMGKTSFNKPFRFYSFSETFYYSCVPNCRRVKMQVFGKKSMKFI